MADNVLKKIIGTKHDRDIKKLSPVVQAVNALEPGMRKMSDADLKTLIARLKERRANGEPLDDLLPEAFAATREAAVRTLGMRHYDVQIIGGIALHQGKIAEMKTGEGKTLVATLACVLNALDGKGVHVVTVNDYLAKRDAEWMGKLYKFLGLRVGVIVHGLTDKQRRRAYDSDITYGQNNEFGFDYLRDNMKFSLRDYVQREHHYAIVDEVDSILIDEARTPLIISGPAEEATDKYVKINAVIPRLRKDIDYIVDEKSRTVVLTEDQGVPKVERLLGVNNLYAPDEIETLHHVNQALKAHTLFKNEVDYVIKDGEVIIVDEFTGRLMPGRRWSDGLHQAIEAKENVKIRSENQTLATVTFQNYFRLYDKLSGMTGTADTEAQEFGDVYELDVMVIPTNLPMIRKDHHDVIYKTEREKFNVILDELVHCHKQGQPVLVGTISIEKSEVLARKLKKRGVPHNVLNAKHHEREAEIVAQAGRKGAITIATNMAGRGTDIMLGGNPEFLARREVEDPDGEDAEEYAEALAKYRKICNKERQEVIAANGLYILGTERHEARRIDNQLRGRSGRQGDPGESRFFLSLEDDLLRIFGMDRVRPLMDRLGMEEGEPIESKMVSKAIQRSQEQVEEQNFGSRKNLKEYDDVMNDQRKAIYGLRRKVLEGEQPFRLHEETRAALIPLLLPHYPERSGPEQWNPVGAAEDLSKALGVKIHPPTDLRTVHPGEIAAHSLRILYRNIEKLGVRPAWLLERCNEMAKMAVDGICKRKEKVEKAEGAKNNGSDEAKDILVWPPTPWEVSSMLSAHGCDMEIDQLPDQIYRNALEFRILSGNGLTSKIEPKPERSKIKSKEEKNKDKKLQEEEETPLSRRLESIDGLVVSRCQYGTGIEEWDLAGLAERVEELYGTKLEISDIEAASDPNGRWQESAVKDGVAGAFFRQWLIETKADDEAHDRILGILEDLVIELVDERCPEHVNPEEWDLAGLKEAVKAQFNVLVDPGPGEDMPFTREAIQDKVFDAVEAKLAERIEKIGLPTFRDLARFLHLQDIDQLWKDHLYAMDHLREGIGLRGYAQKDPKQEYKKEGYNMFVAMMHDIETGLISKLMRVQVESNDDVERFRPRKKKQAPLTESKGTTPAEVNKPPEKPVTYKRDKPKVGRNDPCPCGSGKKYKKCCWAKDQAAKRAG
ncbi:MAG: preprotein translocase subunit SecA [Deltaproteobacteria bacterium]|nr:preprotein translocase subunit SecA [Deltaproteobacteria bacterium]